MLVLGDDRTDVMLLLRDEPGYDEVMLGRRDDRVDDRLDRRDMLGAFGVSRYRFK